MFNFRIKYLLILLLALVGCDAQIRDAKVLENKQDYNIIQIDGCEYIEVDYGILDQRVYSLTHKGNCKNPIHNASKN